MKVLHFISNLEIGGAEILLYNFACRTQVQGVQHTVISLKRVGPIGQALRQKGINVIALGLPSPFAFMQHIIAIIRAIRQADCVHTWLYHANLIGGLLCWGWRPVIWSLHAASLKTSSLKYNTRCVITLGRWLSSIVPARIIACSRSSFDDHARYGYNIRKMTVINNGVDVNIFRPRPELKVKDSLFRVIHAARYDPQKDQNTLLEATALAVALNPTIRLVLCGKGLEPGNAQLMARISVLKLEEYVTLLGPQFNMATLYPAYDLFVMSSRYGEALPLALCEAMASGLAAVVTDVGDCRRIVGESGKCVPPASASALAQAMVTMSRLSPVELARRGLQARETIATSYSFGKMSVDYIHCYKTVCDRTN
ncbi:MAG: glycosyltransferase [Acetobacter okinawensis]|uniref:glycosyltransferase n=1 Tax=Acetobacter okinawensis TaxID=1076594 RepID=UPI0039EBD09C